MLTSLQHDNFLLYQLPSYDLASEWAQTLKWIISREVICVIPQSVFFFFTFYTTLFFNSLFAPIYILIFALYVMSFHTDFPNVE